MGIETEIKMKVPDHAALRASLQRLGARRIGQFLEINAFFDTVDQTLRAGDQGLRLRTSRDLDTRAQTHILSHKGPRQPGELKRREETELVVENASAATVLLKALGFEQFLSYEKMRESWEYGGCRVELDEMPYLGAFAEIEGRTADSIADVQQRLNLADRPSIREGYPSLLSDYLRDNGIDQTIIAISPK